MPRTDVVHLGLMLSALGLAYILPFELLLLAYAVLGPAHYLTEISWLHDRQYFLSAKPIAMLLAAIAVSAVSVSNASDSGLLIWIAFVGCECLSVQVLLMHRQGGEGRVGPPG